MKKITVSNMVNGSGTWTAHTDDLEKSSQFGGVSCTGDGPAEAVYNLLTNSGADIGVIVTITKPGEK